MKFERGKICFTWLVFFVFFLAFGLVPEALSADSGESWRTTYDLVMRWVNFLILVAIIVKFGRRPLKNFLSGRKEEIAYEMRRLEEEKTALFNQVEEMRRQVEESEARFEQIKDRIIEQGRNRKQAIIDDANRESQVLMDSTKNLIDNRLRSAKQKLRAEIIDLAIDKAIRRLPSEVTEEDHRKLVEKFIERAV